MKSILVVRKFEVDIFWFLLLCVDVISGWTPKDPFATRNLNTLALNARTFVGREGQFLVDHLWSLIFYFYIF